MSGPVIAVEGLWKSFGDRSVLSGVDFEVRRGEVFCLLGPNGAGKTTTLEILQGFLRADQGSVEVLGHDPVSQPTALRTQVGVVLQQCGFPDHLRVGELLDAWGSYFEHPRSTRELLDLVELERSSGVLTRHLSGGQRRRLDFALALVGRPDPRTALRAPTRHRGRGRAYLRWIRQTLADLQQ